MLSRGVAGMVACLLLAGCFGRADGAPQVVVGAGTSAEQRVLAALAEVALARAGFDVQVRKGLGDTRGLRREALAGAVDVYWDYTGAAWALGMQMEAPPADPVESYEQVRTADADRDLRWLAPSTANATLALFVRRDVLPADRGRWGLSWLARELSRGNRRLCADADFIRRPGGLDALADAYAMDLSRVLDAAIPAPEPLALAHAASGRCFAALGTATSGDARRRGLEPLADDLMVFPAFVIAPVGRASRLQQLAGVEEALAGVSAVLDTASVAALNAEVARGEEPEDVAEEFLAES
jgi:osmoprotectant transport system substrate-binding protein